MYKSFIQNKIGYATIGKTYKNKKVKFLLQDQKNKQHNVYLMTDILESNNKITIGNLIKNVQLVSVYKSFNYTATTEQGEKVIFEIRELI